MAHFIKLTDEGMASLWVNAAQVSWVEPVPKDMDDVKARAIVHLEGRRTDGMCFWVRERPDHVIALLRGET